MDVITIPQKIIKNDDLVIIPRKKYEQFLCIIKRQNQLDSDLNEAIGQVRRGKAAGPFHSIQELKKSLERRSSYTRQNLKAVFVSFLKISKGNFFKKPVIF